MKLEAAAAVLLRAACLLFLISFPTMTTTEVSENGSTQTKTVFLIRHAESEENRRLASFKTTMKTLARFRLPNTKDVTAGFGLLNVYENVDSHVSEFGQRQIEHMAAVLEQSDFVRRSKIQLVAHSPLIRARETCQGMLGVASCQAGGPDADNDEDDDGRPKAALGEVAEVLELDLLIEKTPAEWLPGNSGSLEKRLRALEDWVAAQSHTVIALVGHSQFFKALLELDYKFGNCDVMEVQFNAPPQEESNTPTKKWTNLKEVHLCRLPVSADTTTAAKDANKNAK